MWWAVLLGVGILCNAAAFARRTVFKSFDKKYLLMCVPLLLTLFILPFPYHLGVIVTLAGIVILVLCIRFPVLAGLGYGAIFSGMILLLQSPSGYLYTTFTSYSHYFYWLDPVFYNIFKFFNLKVSYSQDTFYILTIKDMYPFPTTWEKLAMFPLLNILMGSIVVFYAFSENRRGVRDFMKLLLSGTGFIVIRYVFMILLFLYLMTFVEHGEEICRIDIFWDMRVTLLTFLPFILITAILISLKTEARFQVSSFKFQVSSFKFQVSIALALFFLGLSFGFQDPGEQKNGRVIVDESHSEWEKSTKKMDTEWYGNESGYNFYWLAEFINHHFPLTRNFRKITPELLSDCDILIIKTPTSAFSPEEVRSVRDFVLKGGGLFLIGEHTNVFGTGTYINPIAEEFGFSFRYDVILDIERKFEQLYEPPRLLPHPVVQNMPYFAFKVSCSIQPVSSKCENVILSTGLKSQDIYYPSGNFYPPVKNHTDIPFGAFMQMTGVKAGKGRVLGFTDSTSYSNFEAFIEGKPELMLGSLTWLNRKNKWNNLNILFLILFGVCLVSGIQKLGKEDQLSIINYQLSIPLVVFGVFFFSLALAMCGFLSRKAYPLPRPVTPYTKVVFEQEHGDYELPLKGFTKEHKKSYEVFYLWVLRAECYPFTGKTLKKDLSDETDVLVIINPYKNFQPDEVSGIKNYLRKGGKVLLVDGKRNKNSTANELLEPLGMKINQKRKATLPVPYSSSIYHRQSARNDALTVEGGTPLLYSSEGSPILSAARVGKGMIAVAGFSQLFVNPNMGGSYRVKPDQRLRAIYNLEFSLIRGLAKGDLETLFKAQTERSVSRLKAQIRIDVPNSNIIR
ncbi:amidotransferase domain-containing protein [Desulfonema magnum]|uniref:Amidotransferase domain-containing protein n=1 Tax=Desulfonema magnum TaxID=45655 RepID=A0A975GPV9_9BACT|nr:amidotransferase domain-containing protein [Desulfonema magnum]